MYDVFKVHIKGYRKGGKTCECCREVNKKESRRLARRRLKATDDKERRHNGRMVLYGC